MERLTYKTGEYLQRAGINYLPRDGSDVFDLHNKLGELEDAEEQGLLIRLPFPLDTKYVYFAHKLDNDVYTLDATNLKIYKSENDGRIVYEVDCYEFDIDEFEKVVFVDYNKAWASLKEEAGQALKGGNNG